MSDAWLDNVASMGCPYASQVAGLGVWISQGATVFDPDTGRSEVNPNPREFYPGTAVPDSLVGSRSGSSTGYGTRLRAPTEEEKDIYASQAAPSGGVLEGLKSFFGGASGVVQGVAQDPVGGQLLNAGVSAGMARLVPGWGQRPPPPPPPPPSGPSFGTIALVGMGLLGAGGIAWGLSSRRPAAESPRKENRGR